MFLCSEVLLCPTPRKHCQFLLPIAVIRVLLNSKSWRNITITYKSPNYSAADPQSVRWLPWEWFTFVDELCTRCVALFATFIYSWWQSHHFTAITLAQITVVIKQIFVILFALNTQYIYLISLNGCSRICWCSHHHLCSRRSAVKEISQISVWIWCR
jgi:hypothetical protein